FGGGPVCNPKPAALLNSRSIIVWLKANPETLMARIGSTASRPLLQGG
ncbi:MAG TPA: shikimate kinase, partial [Alphaproteobacteria bacterium]|nr:shikimate kinase [Alphaproteobacteria bacterium]